MSPRAGAMPRLLVIWSRPRKAEARTADKRARVTRVTALVAFRRRVGTWCRLRWRALAGSRRRAETWSHLRAVQAARQGPESAARAGTQPAVRVGALARREVPVARAPPMEEGRGSPRAIFCRHRLA